MQPQKFIQSNGWLAVSEGEGTEGEGTETSPEPKMFGQDEVNKFVAEERRKTQERAAAKLREVQIELESIQASAGMNSEAREQLELSIDSLKQKNLTTEQRSAQEVVRLKSEHAAQIKALTTESSSWQSRFTSASILRELSDAASEHDAYQASQIVAMLQSTTKMVEVEEEEAKGKGAGTFKTVVDFDDIGKDGKPVTLTLTPTEAVKRMKELPEFANLFKDTSKGGLGSTSEGAEQVINMRELAQDPVKYREARAAGRI